MDKKYIFELSERLEFPSEAKSFLLCKLENIWGDRAVLFDDAVWAYESSDYKYDGIEQRLKRIGKLSCVHEYTVALFLLMACCKRLEKRYREAGYGNELFLDTMADLRYKINECKNVKGVWGVSNSEWYSGFFRLERFALGRFQFEKRDFSKEYGVGGNFIKNGDTVINIHIPSSGIPLSDEVRFDSYKKAKEFFFPNSEKPVAFICISWLLYPGYEDIIPDSMNLKKFRHDFALVAYGESEKFTNAWRVFGKDAELPPEKLPRKTGQQRIFADHCMAGGKHGHGYGVFFFDGEKIVK